MLRAKKKHFKHVVLEYHFQQKHRHSILYLVYLECVSKFECSINKVGLNGGEIQHSFYEFVGCVPSSFISTVMGNSQRNRGMSFGRIFITNQSIIYFQTGDQAL